MAPGRPPSRRSGPRRADRRACGIGTTRGVPGQREPCPGQRRPGGAVGYRRGLLAGWGGRESSSSVAQSWNWIVGTSLPRALKRRPWGRPSIRAAGDRLRPGGGGLPFRWGQSTNGSGAAGLVSRGATAGGGAEDRLRFCPFAWTKRGGRGTGIGGGVEGRQGQARPGGVGRQRRHRWGQALLGSSRSEWGGRKGLGTGIERGFRCSADLGIWGQALSPGELGGGDRLRWGWLRHRGGLTS